MAEKSKVASNEQRRVIAARHAQKRSLGCACAIWPTAESLPGVHKSSW